MLDEAGRVLLSWSAGEAAADASFPAVDFLHKFSEGDHRLIETDDFGAIVFGVQFAQTGLEPGYLAGKLRAGETAEETSRLKGRLRDSLPLLAASGLALSTSRVLSENSGRATSRLDHLNNQNEALQEVDC